LFGDRLDGDVVNVDFVFPDEEKQKIERAFKDLELDAVVGIGSHGEKRGLSGGGARQIKTAVGF
jgi:hypothetical protein